MRTKFILFLVTVVTLAGLAPLAMAQTCDYPLFIKQGSVDANVVFLFDSSGSMNDAIMHDDYDPTKSYNSPLKRGNTYDITTSGTYSPRSFDKKLATTPTAYLVASDAGEPGSYDGNYLNWAFSAATTAQRNAIPRLTRVQLAKQAVNAVIASADPRVRFGVFKFNGTVGGQMVSALGTDRATIATQVNAIHATGYTPLAKSR